MIDQKAIVEIFYMNGIKKGTCVPCNKLFAVGAMYLSSFAGAVYGSDDVFGLCPHCSWRILTVKSVKWKESRYAEEKAKSRSGRS